MYAITIALNHTEIGKHPERISKIIPYIPNYNCEHINFPAQRKDWENFEKDNDDIALNILSVLHNKKKAIEVHYKSKFNHTHLKQVVLLMITNRKKWHYLALKSIPTNDGHIRPTQSISKLKITSTNTTNDYYCLNCFQSFRTEDTLKKHELVCEDHDYCELVMPEDKHKILKHATGSKSLKIPHTIYLDIECQLKKHDTCANNLNKAWSITKNTHEPTGYTINSVNEYQNNYHTYYRGADCMTKLSQDLLKIRKEILNEEKKDIPLKDDEKTKQQQSKYCYLCN